MKRRFVKVFACMAVTAMMLSVTACGSKEAAAETAEAVEETATEETEAEVEEEVEAEAEEVEEALMKEGFYQVAKSFMLYRQRHTEDRETMEKLRFLADYCEAANAATGSKYDANANVEHKNIATLIGELPKSNFIRLNRRLLTDRIKKMYGKETSEKYIDLLTHHFIYKNDETSLLLG